MKNPWLSLRGTGNPYIFDKDLAKIDTYNRFVLDPRARVIRDVIPEPFIGNPNSAQVVFLGLNPGYSISDPVWHAKEPFKKALFLNLGHELQDYPFYPLNPAFAESGAGSWWGKRTSQLREASELDDKTFAERFMVIEWFPYHSVRFKVPKEKFESQEYAFQLAKDMLARKLVVRMRSKSLWANVDPRFGEAPSLLNPQCGYITPGNTEGDLFGQIVEALRRKSKS
jgi:hypothetical protein